MQITRPFLDSVPIWIMFLVILMVILLSIETGFRHGARKRKLPNREQEAPVSSMIGAALALLAFILAFTFGMATSRFETRKSLTLDEANAIQTTYLRAGLLSEPQRTDIRNLLREYVKVRVEGIETGQINYLVKKSEELQDQLWSKVTTLSEKKPPPVFTGLFIRSLNDVIDLHAKRLTAAMRNRIPGAIWGALFFVTSIAMGAVGYQMGLNRGHRTIVALAIVLTFAVIMFVIADLDHPQQGFLQISQEPMIELQKDINKPAP
ncbi:MAG: hypothetical protein JRC93_09715 [Deltaproteobacteria bacterium]|nr:hypothetical protein [Deltaproteobacteria bacterium]